MNTVRKISDGVMSVGGNDTRLNLFESAYPLPHGVSYNSYVILDEKTAVIDTVDKSIEGQFFENVESALDGKEPDYLVILHMEPDHSATLKAFLEKYPKTVAVVNQKIKTIIAEYWEKDLSDRLKIMADGETLDLGKHKLTFVFAPMVHWPEVMVAYESYEKILFSADAFGSFGTTDGKLFVDEVNFNEYLGEFRRYYTNIVGKYGPSVQALLKKAAALEIKTVCPLHGLCIRKDLEKFIEKYSVWSSYGKETKGVLVCYASVYGHTAIAAEKLAAVLNGEGVNTEVYDVSTVHKSYLVSKAFEYSAIVFASATYNAGLFVNMDDFMRDLKEHNLQNRTVALIENGTWAPFAKTAMTNILNTMKNIRILPTALTIHGALKGGDLETIKLIAEEIKEFA